MLVKPLHVGIGVDQNLPWATLVDRWRLIEALGFDSIWDFDHLNQPSRPEGRPWKPGLSSPGWRSTHGGSGSASW